MENGPDSPFKELPQALVEEMLSKCGALGSGLLSSFANMQKQKGAIRGALSDTGLLKKENDIYQSPANPTTCGVDGSYVVEKLISMDIVAAAGVAVEGLIPPSEKRHWPRPRHIPEIKAVKHNADNSMVVRALMMTMELELATKAPHDIVFLDGSVTTPLIYLNQGINRANNVDSTLSTLFKDRFKTSLAYYKEILASQRTDKIFVFVPKYTSRREVSDEIGVSMEYEDRALLTFVLDGGEFVGPLRLEPPKSPWHLDNPFREFDGIVEEITSAMKRINVIYYKPVKSTPAIRMEISESIAKNTHRLSILLEGVKYQCGSPSIMEPYPTYMADRMVKHLGTAVPAMRKSSVQEMAYKWDKNVDDIILAMHSYRSESNR